MIRIEFSAAAALYLSIVTGILFFCWVFFGRSWAFGGGPADDKYVWQCSICTYCYIDSRHSEISLCPRCGSYNNKEHKTTDKHG